MLVMALVGVAEKVVEVEVVMTPMVVEAFDVVDAMTNIEKESKLECFWYKCMATVQLH